MKNKLGTMDLILLIIGIFLTVFTATMIVIHCVTGSTPDTLIQCVYNTCGFECGAMGVIKSVKLLNMKLKSKQKNSNLNANNSTDCEICEETTEIPEDFYELEEKTLVP